MRKYALNIADDKRILSATFEEYASEGMPIVETLPEGDIADYKLVNEKYVYEPVTVPSPTIEEQIAELKVKLAESDYKVIKCAEAQMAGEELPYDIVELHAERQTLRNEINALEGVN